MGNSRHSTYSMSTRFSVGHKLAAILVAVAVVGLLALAAQKSPMVVHYLSPKVLTRTAMSPERLKKEEFRIQGSITQGDLVARLFDLSRAANRARKEPSWKYDFRLCISSGQDSVCFSADGAIGLAKANTFSLSSGEQQRVMELFSQLDSIGVPPK